METVCVNWENLSNRVVQLQLCQLQSLMSSSRNETWDLVPEKGATARATEKKMCNRCFLNLLVTLYL